MSEAGETRPDRAARKRKAPPGKRSRKKSEKGTKRSGGGRKGALVIVESPAKAKAIQKYLGPDFKVRASLGHVRDLPRTRIGIDIENGYTPKYQLIRKRKGVIDDLRKEARKAEIIYLAPDPDREGEAIAWHLVEALRLPAERVRRVTFHEVTPRAVREAFERSEEIDRNKVEAQQARRILDRLVGYKLSPLLWKKVARGLSAGRVQSVAVRLVVEREREIEAFDPEEYWKLTARLHRGGKEDPPFDALLVGIGDQGIRTSAEPADVTIGNEKDAAAQADAVRKESFRVAKVVQRKKTDNPPPPFITSTMQQQASNRFGYTARRTMRVAQQLYEGIDLPGEGPVGLITYMRTDAVRMADEALAACREWIGKNYPKEYLPEEPRRFKTAKRAQAAHEAIRPTDFARTPERIRDRLTEEQFKLYKLVWTRAVAGQMAAAEIKLTRAEIEAGDHRFQANGRVIEFDGYLRLAKRKDDSQPLPDLTKGDDLDLEEIQPTQHFTLPPPRYTEASLIRTLEKSGIGRPSTYAPILSTIQDRGYAIKDGRNLKPTELGTLVTDKLLKHFPKIMEVAFTSEMESALDRIESEHLDWRKVLDDFYLPFSSAIEKAEEGMEDVRSNPEETGQDCEQCGKPMVIKWSRRGRFLACSGFPECRNAKSIDSEGNVEETPEIDETCEQCGKPMTVKTGRYGRFLACTGYPDCKTTRGMPTGVPCPKEGCAGQLVARRTRKGNRRFYGCSRYPDCEYVANALPEPAAS